MTLYKPTEKLPQIGQRVQVICIKEMIFEGNEDDSGGDWKDDGEGKRAIMMWSDLDDPIIG